MLSISVGLRNYIDMVLLTDVFHVFAKQIMPSPVTEFTGFYYQPDVVHPSTLSGLTDCQHCISASSLQVTSIG
jgi:hypothetical protein